MKHIPVLLNEVVDFLHLSPGMRIIDGTLGDAGHAEKILERISPGGKLLGIDADVEAVLRAKQYLYNFGERVIFVRDNFVNLTKIVAEQKFFPVNGILLDLGWSSPQFEERGRGFSFTKPDEKLDMRYNVGLQTIDHRLSTIDCGLSNRTASELLNELSVEHLEKIFREYGEEKLSKEIAEAVTEKRKIKDIEKTSELVEIILSVYRTKLNTEKKVPWVGGLHPATKVFQALRIAVNDELGAIEAVLPQAIEVLAPGGRLAVISFHSLEDRIVKHFFKDAKSIKIVTKKPVECSDEESASNPRARSAKLRVIEKL